MSKRKKEMVGLFCVALLIFLQAGCGNSTNQTSTGEPSGLIVNQPVTATVPSTQSAGLFVPATEELSSPGQAAGTNCSLDAISWQPALAAMVIDHHATVEFQGWAADDTFGVPSKVTILLIREGRTFAAAGATGQLRPDVASARKNPAFLKSGYAVNANLRDVPQGEYRVALVEQFGGGERNCDLGKTIAVK